MMILVEVTSVVSIPACQLCHHSEITDKTCCAHWSVPSHHTPKGHSHLLQTEMGEQVSRGEFVPVGPKSSPLSADRKFPRHPEGNIGFSAPGKVPWKSMLSVHCWAGCPLKRSGCKPLGLAWGFSFQQIKDYGLWFQLNLSAPIQDSLGETRSLCSMAED